MLEELVLPGGLHCRNVKPQDDIFLEPLFRSSRPHLSQIPLPAEFTNAVVRQQYQLQQASYQQAFPGLRQLLILHDDSPIGRLMLDLNGKNRTLHLVDICLSPEECGKGVGTLLLRTLQSIAERRGWGMCLSVDRHNWRAYKLYVSLGFQVESISTTRYTMRWSEVLVSS